MNRRVLWATVLVAVLALVVGLRLVGEGGDPGGSTTAPGRPGDASGLAVVAAADLPREARETIRLIDAGGPFPYARDGATFGNVEGILPRERRGFYREYTVPTPGSRDRGARRIVAGDGARLLYYTDDHYQSFRAVRR